MQCKMCAQGSVKLCIYMILILLLTLYKVCNHNYGKNRKGGQAFNLKLTHGAIVHVAMQLGCSILVM